MDHRAYMAEALSLAEQAAALDEVPVGALLVRQGINLGEGFNRNIETSDPTAHAEINALREACAYLGNYRLKGSTLYVTLEPCLMCFTAMIHARVSTLVYGAADPKTGFSRFLDGSGLALFNHQMNIIAGVRQAESAELIRNFFRTKRERGKRKWMKHLV